MHCWSWDDLCKPKVERGTGLRRVHDIVVVAGLMLVWKLHSSNSTVAFWMRGHYLKRTHFSDYFISPRFRPLEVDGRLQGQLFIGCPENWEMAMTLQYGMIHGYPHENWLIKLPQALAQLLLGMLQIF